MHAFILMSTFAIFSVVLSATIRRFQLVPSWLDDLKILSVCLVMSPIGLAFCYGILLRIFPMQSPNFYFYTIMIPLLAAGFLCLSEIQRIKNVVGSLPFVNKLFVLSGCTLLASIAVVNWKIPVYANDPLEYFTVARAIFENQRLTGIYPLLSEDIASGFYAPWTHPPGFVLTLAWAFVVQGSADEAGVAKLINIFYLFAMLAIVFAWSNSAKKQLGLMAALLLMISPLIINETFEHHVDVGRIGLWTASLCLTTIWLTSANFKFTIFLGVLVGLLMFVHSTGILFWALFIGLLIFLRDIPFTTRFLHSALLVVISLCFVLYDYYTSYINLGYFIGDSIKIWQIPELGIVEYLNEQRGITSLSDKVSAGIINPLYQTSLYGYSNLAAVLMILGYLAHIAISSAFNFKRVIRHVRSPDYLNVYFLLNTGFFAIVFLSAVIDINTLVKNPRYLISMTALQCIFAVLVLNKLLPFIEMFFSRKTISPLILTDGVSKKTFDVRLNFNFLFRLKFKNNPSHRGEPIIFLLLRIFLVIFLIDAGFDNLRQQNRNAHVFAPRLHQDDEYFTQYLWNSPHGGFNLVGLLNANLLYSKEPPKVKVLSFRPSDSAYYGLYQQIPYTDPKLVSAFLSSTVPQLFQELSDLEVTHIIVPSYKMGEIEKTSFKDFFDDSKYAFLVSSMQDYHLYRIQGAPEIIKNNPSNILKPTEDQYPLSDAQKENGS